MIEMMRYQHPNDYFHEDRLLHCVVFYGTFEHFERFINLIGEQVFVEHFFDTDGRGWDVMKFAVMSKKTQAIEYILSIEALKERYLSDNAVLHKLCRALNRNRFKDSTYTEALQCVVDNLGLTREKLYEVQEYKWVDMSRLLPLTK